jgi:hypothetical protein
MAAKKSNNENLGKDNDKSQVFTFALNSKQDIPSFSEQISTGKKYVSWGKKNDFPIQMVKLADTANLHGRIIKSVSEQVGGMGVRIKDGKSNSKLEAIINKCNSKDESLYDVIKKIAIDDTYFNAFSTSIVWQRGKSLFDLYHTDLTTLRPGIMDVTANINEFFFSTNWLHPIPTYTEYPAFDSNNRMGTQIYYCMPYSPSVSYFPKVAYQHLINYILLDSKISRWMNKNMDNNWCPNVHINFNNGIPKTREEAKRILMDLLDDHEGVDNTSRVFATFSNGKETSPDVNILNRGKNDTSFIDLANLVMQQTLSGWGIVSPELVGIKSGGNLGDGNFVESSELFFNTVIQPRQKKIEEEINYLLSTIGFTDEIEIVPMQPVSFSLPPQYMLMISTINEMRELIGKDPIEGGDVIVEQGKISTIGNPNNNTSGNTESNQTTNA